MLARMARTPAATSSRIFRPYFVYRLRVMLLAAAAGIGIGNLAHAAEPPTAGSLLQQQAQPPAIPEPQPPLALPPPAQSQPPPEPASPAQSTASPLEAGVHVAFSLRAVQFEGNTVIGSDQLAAVVAPWIGKPAKFADLVHLAEAVTDYYRRQGYHLARATLPPQDIVDGVLRIAMLEGRYGVIRIDNRSGRDAMPAVRAIRAVAAGGEVVRLVPLENRLLLVNDLPGTRATAAFTTGTEPGEADFVAILEPVPRAAGRVVADNHGDYFTGRGRVAGTVSAYDIAGGTDRLDFTLMTTGEQLLHAGADYAAPVFALRHRLGVAASWLDYRLGRSLEALDSNGDTLELQAYWKWQLERSRAANTATTLRLLQREMEDRIDALAVESPSSVSALRASVNVDNRDAWRPLTWQFEATLTAGQLTLDSATDRLLDAMSAQTEGTFAKLGLRALGRWRIGPGTALASLEGQLAAGNLDSSEKMTIAGPNAVRAYPVGEQSGDDAWLARVDWTVPFEVYGGEPGWTGRVFVDAGQARFNKQTWAGFSGDNTRLLAGVGAGVGWTEDEWTLELAVARRVGSEEASVNGKENVQLWGQLTWTF